MSFSLLLYKMPVSEFLVQPCNKSDIPGKLVTNCQQVILNQLEHDLLEHLL